MTFPITVGLVLPVLVGGFLLAALVSLLATPSIERYVREHRILDHPDPRRVHDEPLPRGGGVAVVLAFVIVGGGAALIRDTLPGLNLARP